MAIGSITLRIVCSLVAPKALLPLRYMSGIAFNASSVVLITIGNASSPRVSEPARILSPNPRVFTKSVIPKRPNIIDGIPERLFVMTRMNFTTKLLGAYSVV